MSAAAIARQNDWRAAMELYFSQGNQAMNDLVSSLGGNPVAGLAPGQGDAGVPTSGIPFIANGVPIVIPGPAAAPPSAWDPHAFLPTRGRRNGGGSGGGASRCVPPTVKPLVTVFPVPAVTAPAAAPVSRPVAAPPPVPAPAPARRQIMQADCMSGNICLDIRNGCVLASQVSPQQLLACSQAGYAGNLNLYAQIDVNRQEGPSGYAGFLGTPQPNPVRFSPDMLNIHPGLSGVPVGTQPGAGVFWGSVGLALFGLYAAHEFGKSKARR